jgi:predicted ester cyclase
MFDLEANKAVALRLVEVFNGRRLDLLEDVLRLEFRGRGISAFPPESPEVGPSARRKLYEMFYQAIPDARAEVQDIVAEGDKVVLVDHFGGTHRGEFRGRPGTGDRIEWMAIHNYTIRDGKVLEDAVMTDELAMMQQLGLLPELAPRTRRNREAAMVGSQRVFSILDEAAAVIGGWTALQSIRRVRLDSERQDWEPWQAHDIGGTVDVSTFRIATDLDLGAGASRVEMEAEVVYPWPHRVAYIETTDAEAGMLADLSLVS